MKCINLTQRRLELDNFELQKYPKAHYTLEMAPKWNKEPIRLKHAPFRRTGPSGLINIGVATAIGVVSGYYIFGIPLRDHWAEENARLAAEGQASTTTQSTNSK
mmetsp:Transcript_6873/g.8971  ORF Transcript_6873/g.8971 Transcript_6873/m.8971 type:complete len:104 (-) Transcript_6873:151-462(-)